jgi:hypothetical protein
MRSVASVPIAVLPKPAFLTYLSDRLRQAPAKPPALPLVSAPTLGG